MASVIPNFASLAVEVAIKLATIASAVAVAADFVGLKRSTCFALATEVSGWLKTA